jgi:hypothetical protein
MKFERKSETVVVAFFKKERTDWEGKPFKCNEAARAIKEASGWRIDHCAALRGVWLPWEPIDSVPRRTLTEAKLAIRAYANAGPGVAKATSEAAKEVA